MSAGFGASIFRIAKRRIMKYGPECGKCRCKCDWCKNRSHCGIHDEGCHEQCVRIYR